MAWIMCLWCLLMCFFDNKSIIFIIFTRLIKEFINLGHHTTLQEGVGCGVLY